MTIHDRLPGEEAANHKNTGLSNLSGIAEKDKRSTRPLNRVHSSEDKPFKDVKARKPAFTVVMLAILVILLLSGFTLYAMRPDYIKQAFGFFLPTNTSTAESATRTADPFLEIASKTPTFTNSPLPTSTDTPVPTLTSTMTPSATVTRTPPATPMGGASQIAFVSNRSGAYEIWLMNIDGSGLEMITNIAEGVCQPKWSPDGNRIIFISPCKRNMTSYPGASMFIINSDGSGIVPLPSVPGGDYDPSWSPDGTQIAFTSLRREGVPGIYIINLSDYTVTSLVEDETNAISQPAWSPDGSQIAYVNSDNRVWVMDTKGENRHTLIQGGGDYLVNGPAWSPDGSAVIFTRSVFSDTTGSTMLLAVPYTENGAVPIEVPNSQLVSDVSYSFDGYWLLFTSWFSGNHDINIMRANGIDRQAIGADQSYDFDPAWRPIPVNLP